MKNFLSVSSAALALGITSTLIACSSSDHATDSVTLTSVTAQAGGASSTSDAVSLTSSIVGIEGTYGASCARTGFGESTSDRWAAEVNEHSWSDIGNPPADPVKVVAGNVDCQLFIDTIITNEGGSAASYTAATPMLLATSFSPVVTFTGPRGTFGVTSEISKDTYRADFGIQLYLSSLNTGSVKSYASFQRVTSSTAEAADIPAPSAEVYTYEITTEVDASYEITVASGYASIYPGPQADDAFVLLPGDLTTADYDTLNSTYWGNVDSATPSNVFYFSDLEDNQLDAEAFGLVGSDLSDGPAVRSLVFANHDKDTDVTSYQVVALRFFAPFKD